jgi:DNA-binding transcriptional ArsR family regulator
MPTRHREPDLDAIFRTLADPTRRAILEHLVHEGEVRPKALVKSTGRSQPLVQLHLAKLAKAGLLERRAVGRRSWYSLDPRPLAEARTWLSRLEADAKKRKKARTPSTR